MENPKFAESATFSSGQLTIVRSLLKKSLLKKTEDGEQHEIKFSSWELEILRLSLESVLKNSMSEKSKMNSRTCRLPEHIKIKGVKEFPEIEYSEQTELMLSEVFYQKESRGGPQHRREKAVLICLSECRTHIEEPLSMSRLMEKTGYSKESILVAIRKLHDHLSEAAIGVRIVGSKDGGWRLYKKRTKKRTYNQK